MVEAKDTLEVRQHIAWLFQYVQGMNERNWHDMKLRAERQLEQLSLAFPGPSDTSTVETCTCVGAVIGSHDSSCPYADTSTVREGEK